MPTILETNENELINQVPQATSIVGAMLLGSDSEGKTKNFKVSDIAGDYKGLASADTNPGIPFLSQSYDAKPGLTYVNFKDAGGLAISIPEMVGDDYVISARLVFNGNFWEAIYTPFPLSLGPYDRLNDLKITAAVSGKEPSFNFLSRSVTFFQSTEYVPTMRKAATIFYEQPSDVVLNIPDDYMGYIFLNKTSKLPELYGTLDPQIQAKLSDSNLILFCTYFTQSKTVSMNGMFKINGNLFGIDFQSHTLIHGKNDTFNFDIKNRVIYFPKEVYVTKNKVGTIGDILYPVALNLPPLNIPGGDGFHFLVFNSVLVNFRLVYFSDLVAVAEVKADYRYVFIGYVYPAGDIAVISGNYKVNGMPFNYVEQYDNMPDRFMFPRSMFLFNDEKLPLYKKGLFRDFRAASRAKVSLLTIDQTVSSGDYRRLEVLEPVLLIGSEVGNLGTIIVEPDINPGTVILKRFQIYKILRNAKSGANITIMMFGDSLTQGNAGVITSPIYELKRRLALPAIGINATMVGSFNIESPDVAALGGNYMGEGRGYWQYKNFVGRNNKPYGQLITPKFTGGGSTKFQNPFLRLANNTDKTAHPNWCFRNTGSQNELSYQEDADKTGNFYIFDYGNYLSVQGIQPPNIITIALGTNDWQEFTSGGVGSYAMGQSVEALEIMLTKMLEATPSTTKIIVVPANALSISRAEWETYFFPLMETVTTMIEYKFGADRVSLCAIYAHASRWGCYQATTPETFLSGNNNTVVTTRSNDVHALDIVNGEGMDAYMKALLPAIVFSV
ncbi:MAG: hypothetical protein EOO42_01160 [Flavobacteriales bacterium]|nr:MAG: hypothetical protein EOO42_01160 [Flavobacteriales bacterium]